MSTTSQIIIIIGMSTTSPIIIIMDVVFMVFLASSDLFNLQCDFQTTWHQGWQLLLYKW